METLGSRTVNWKKNFNLKTFQNTYCQMIAFPESSLLGFWCCLSYFKGISRLMAHQDEITAMYISE